MHRGPTGIAYNPHRLLDTYPKLEKYIVKVLRDAGARIYYMSSTACSYKYLPVQQSSVEMLKSGGRTQAIHMMKPNIKVQQTLYSIS